MCSTLEQSVIEFGTEVATRQVFEEPLRKFLFSSNRATGNRVYIEVLLHPDHQPLGSNSKGRIGHMAWSEFAGYDCNGVIFSDVYLDPAHRGKGLGSALLSMRLRAVQQAGYKAVFATVRDDNAQELALLKKQSFKEIAKLPSRNEGVSVTLMLRLFQ